MNIKKLTALITAVVVFALPIGNAAGITAVSAAGTDGWTPGSVNSDSGAYVDTDVFYGGGGSLKCYNNTKRTGEQYFSLTTNVQVKKGKTYKYGFMAKGEKLSRATVMIDWGTRTSLTPFRDSYDWTPFEITYKHETDANTVMLRIVLDDKSNGLWLDNVYFYEVDEGSYVGENLIKNGTFDAVGGGTKQDEPDTSTLDPLTAYLATGKMIPAYKAEGITVDGDFSDWSDKYNIIPITAVTKLKSCTPDAKANIRYAWDEQYFYIAVDVTDDSFEPVEGSGYWTGDSLQVSFSNDDSTKKFGTEIGFNYIPSKDSSDVNGIDGSDIQYKASQNGQTVYYEIAVPWSIQFGEAVPETFLFNVLVNDTDNGSRNYCLEADAGAISVSKSAKTNPVIVLKDGKDADLFLSEVHAEPTMAMGTETEYTVKVFNASDSEKTYTVSCAETGDERTLTVPANSAGTAAMKYMAADSGSICLNIRVSDGETVQKLYAPINVLYSEELPSLEECEEMLSDMDGYVEHASQLMTKCAHMGLELDYEMVDYYILERFTAMQKDKIAAGKYDFITYQYAKLTEIYNELVKTLESYIKGEAKPKKAVRMVTSGDRDIIDGQSFIRDVEVDGEIEKRPYIYTGTGHWNYVWNDFENLHKLGYDFMHIEIGPNSVIFPESFASAWDISVLGSVPDYSVEVQDKTVHSGSYAVKLVNNTPYNYNNFFTVWQTVDVEPNTVYEFGMYAKGTNVSNSLKLHMGSMAYQDRVACGGTYDWTEYSGTYKTGPDETTASFVLTSDSPTTVMYIDDVYIRKQGDDSNLIKNPGFENGTNDPDSIGDGMKASYRAIENLEKVFESAEENDMAIDLLITPHYFPTFLATKDPTINDNGKVPFQFMPFNPTHPTVRKVLEKYIEILVSRVKDYKSLHSIVLSNEPAFAAAYGTYYLPQYHEYLKEKYGTIEELNRAYGGSEYASFDEIGWPRAAKANPYWHDYRVFNDEILNEYHHYLAAAVKKYAPDVPVHTKQMSNFRAVTPPANYDYRMNGANYELWMDAFDINGNDGGGAAFNGEGNNMYNLLGWYDWLTSVKNVPCVNSEDHILAATDDMDYSSHQPAYCGAQIWQGAIHGRGGSNIWLWEVREFGENNALLTNQPMVVSKTGKAGLDLNRAAYEVAAIQNEPRRVAILKSEESLEGNFDSTNACFITYYSVLENGLRPMFLTDYNYAKMHDYEVVFVPDMRYVSDSVFDELEKYQKNGGKVVVFGEKALGKDELGHDRDAERVRRFLENAEVSDIKYLDKNVTEPEIIEKAVRKAIVDEKLDIVSVYDKGTGEKAVDVEWLSGVHDGKISVNLCSYDWDKDKTVYIEVNGKRVESFFEHRGEKTYDNGEITLKAYEPVIVSFETDNPFFDTYGHWAEQNIKKLYADGLVNGKSASRFAPEDTLTGAEFATLLARELKLDTKPADGEAWYAGAVKALENAGIADGELGNADAPISRENICALAVRAFEYDAKSTAKETDAAYSDAAEIAADKLSFVKKAAALGLMKGDETNRFRPASAISRAEASAVIERLSSLN